MIYNPLVLIDQVVAFLTTASNGSNKGRFVRIPNNEKPFKYIYFTRTVTRTHTHYRIMTLMMMMTRNTYI